MTPIRVMSFNIFSPGELEEGDELPPEELHNGWEDRADLNVRTILRYEPDLIGFQEMDQEKLATYRERLVGYDWISAEGDEYPPDIAWRGERLALVESGQFWLSSTPDERSADWDVPYPLQVQWVRLREAESSAELLHLNTQYEDGPWGERSRLESSKLMVTRVTEMQQDGASVILTGDFNCNPWSPAYNTFIDAGFTDSYRAAGHGDSATSSTFHGLRGDKYFALEYGISVFWRVDWILTHDGERSLRTTSSTIVRDAEPPTYPSDHYPVVAEFLLD